LDSMQESAYPAGAVALPRAPSRTPIIAAIVALLVGAGITAGAFLLTDGDTTTTTRTIVSTPVSPGEGTALKDEAATAAAVGKPAPVPQTLGGQEQYGTSQYRVDPSTGFATKDYSQNGATGDIQPPATRYDGGPEEGSADVTSAARP
jgi:hypothetical protein